jgi:hypothetical protein
MSINGKSFRKHNGKPGQYSRRFPIEGVGLAAVFLLLAGLFLGQQPQTTLAQRGSAEGGNILYLPLLSKSNCLRYLEQDQLLVMEVEHAPPVEDWAVETALTGFTGESYYTWRGPNLYVNPGVAVLSYPIQITNPGIYNFRLHNRHDFPNPTEENDVFSRMDNGPWIKTFSSTGGQWTWTTAFDFGTAQVNAEYNLAVGPHTLQISARSYGFSIDRITFFAGVANGEDTSLPVSDCAE